MNKLYRYHSPAFIVFPTYRSISSDLKRTLSVEVAAAPFDAVDAILRRRADLKLNRDSET